MAGIRITTKTSTETLAKRIAAHDNSARRVISGVMKFTSGEMTRYAKENAPWTDDTGAARNGLHTVINHPSENVWEIVLAHSVRYGIFLETRWSGKYEIIRPTIDEYSILVMDRISRMLVNVAKRGPSQMVWEYDSE